MSFESLNVGPEIIRALNYQGIKIPTPIQKKSIPLIKSGEDIIGISKTGSGKTAAFGIPLMEMVVPGEGIQALVIAPTRELASQIAEQLDAINLFMDVSISAIYGGVSMEPQLRDLKTSDILVGTPGRLIDHIKKRSLDLSSLKCLVVDEADIMVDMGFIDSIKYILNRTPEDRQLLLFGATISDEIEGIKKEYMHDPAFVKVSAYVGDEQLKQYYYDLKYEDMFSMLVHIIEKDQPERAIVFCSTRSDVEVVAKNLRANGIRAGLLHGKLRQNSRQKVMDNFNEGKPPVLVTSGVASRGLDIDFVSHVINYGLSPDPQEYIHRIGRTARAGRSGKAISLLGPGDRNAFERILAKYRKLSVEQLPSEKFRRVELRSDRALARFKHNTLKRSRKKSEEMGSSKESDVGSAESDMAASISRDDLSEGCEVFIILKKDQRTGKLTQGKIKDILTKSTSHPKGIKVKLEDGSVGRVQKIVK